MEPEADSSHLASESPTGNSPTVTGVPATIRMSASIHMERSYQDLEGWLSKLSQGMPLAENEVKLLCDLARETFLQESNVQPVSAPVTVCGDIHGTFLTQLCLCFVWG